MTALGQAVEEEISSIIARNHIAAIAITAELRGRLHVGSTMVRNLYKVVVAIGINGEAHRQAVAHLQVVQYLVTFGRIGNVNALTIFIESALDVNASRGLLYLFKRLHILSIYGAPRCTIGRLFSRKGAHMVALFRGHNIAQARQLLRHGQLLAINLQHRGFAFIGSKSLCVATQEGRHGINSAERCVPSLCALAL